MELVNLFKFDEVLNILISEVRNYQFAIYVIFNMKFASFHLGTVNDEVIALALNIAVNFYRNSFFFSITRKVPTEQIRIVYYQM